MEKLVVVFTPDPKEVAYNENLLELFKRAFRKYGYWDYPITTA